MRVFNTLSQKKETFIPLAKRKVGMYVCGPTVYDVGHLGHARAAVSFDIIRRYFAYKGFKVTFVCNITDVDDKIIKRAAEEKVTESQLAERIIPKYAEDYGALRVLPPDCQPRATQYIEKMVKLVERLMEKGAAYATDDGVYFEVKKYKKYGQLSRQKLDELIAGARITVDEKKKNPEDFALWKKEKSGEPSWKGPFGMQGRPGWHIECSAMSADILGETFDIHGGGIDLQFPHHEDERAQSETASGKTFARYWLHNGHIQVNKEKMSKSLGNFFTIEDILARWNPLVVRYFLFSTHYRMPIEFSEDLLEQARQSLVRLHDFMRRLRGCGALGAGISIQPVLAQARARFEEAMDDDFEISRALAAVFDFVKEINVLLDEEKLGAADVEKILSFMDSVDTVLAVFHAEESVNEEVFRLIAERNAARAARNFEKADEIREMLVQKGILLEDTAEGTLWKRML